MDRSGKALENTGTSPGPERRSSPRARSRLGVSYEDVDRHVFLKTADLSEDGVFLVSPALPPIGASAMVVLELPGNPAILRLRGRVTRHQTRPVAGFAVRFDAPASAGPSRRALRDFVDETLGGAGSTPP